jgi:hypothetical protein
VLSGWIDDYCELEMRGSDAFARGFIVQMGPEYALYRDNRDGSVSLRQKVIVPAFSQRLIEQLHAWARCSTRR